MAVTRPASTEYLSIRANQDRIYDLSSDLQLLRSKASPTQLLVDKGANTNICNNDGETALILAVDHEHTEILRFILNRGALVNDKDEGGATTLMYACTRWYE